MTSRPTPQRFRIEIQATPTLLGDQATRSLRALLKTMLRSFGLRCTSVVRIDDDDAELPADGTNS